MYFLFFSCSKRQNICEHKIRVIFSAIDDGVRVETTLSGSHEDLHEPTTTLTTQVKNKITELHQQDLKPAVIRTCLLVSLFFIQL